MPPRKTIQKAHTCLRHESARPVAAKLQDFVQKFPKGHVQLFSGAFQDAARLVS